MRGGNVLRKPGSIFGMFVAGATGASALAGCGEGAPPTNSTVTVTAEAPATTSNANKFVPLVGSVAHTENAQGTKEGAWTYRGPQATPEDAKSVRVVQEGATVHPLCHAIGRTIPLTEQSPNLGIPETKDWLNLQVAEGSGPEWIPQVYVDIAPGQPTVPEC